MNQSQIVNKPRVAAVPQAFTLVEILIVVVVLGILSAIVIPQFSNAANESRDSSIKMNLFRIRTQLEYYKQEHGDTYPTLAEFVAQMAGATNESGDAAALGTAGYPFGPYLSTIPKNANTNANTISDQAVGQSDWYYDESTGAFHANDSALTRAW